MKSPCSLFVLITIAFLPDTLHCQEIHLNELRRRDCTKVDTNGLADNSFSYFFNATVKLNKQLEDYTIVQFEILRKNSNDYTFLFDVSIAYECSGLKLEINHHCRKIGDGIFNIDVSLRNESGDKIRGQVIHYNKTVLATDVKELSRANEAADSTGLLQINGEKMSSDMNCTKTIDVQGLIVEFECSNPDTPCVIEVKVDDTIVINQTADRAVFEEQVQSGREILVNIKYAACSFNGKVNNLRCFIKTDADFDETASEGGLVVDNVIIISVAVTVSVLILIVLLVIILVKRLKRQNLKNNEKNIEDDKSHNSEDTVVSPILKGPEKNVKLNDDNQPLLEVKKDEQEQDEAAEDGKAKESTLEMDIFTAAKKGQYDILQELINTNPSCINDRDTKGFTALMHASKHGNEKIAQLLIEKEADIYIKDSRGMTALMISSEKGQQGIAEKLFERVSSKKGMNLVLENPQTNVKEFINETNEQGMTPLILASRGCHETYVHLLMDYKADVDLKDNYGYTALMYACEYGYVLIAKSLIRGKADVNKKTPKGKTCLMLASECGHENIVELLLTEKALIDERDDEGSTALSLALKQNHKNIVQILLANGAG